MHSIDVCKKELIFANQHEQISAYFIDVTVQQGVGRWVIPWWGFTHPFSGIYSSHGGLVFPPGPFSGNIPSLDGWRLVGYTSHPSAT